MAAGVELDFAPEHSGKERTARQEKTSLPAEFSPPLFLSLSFTVGGSSRGPSSGGNGEVGEVGLALEIGKWRDSLPRCVFLIFTLFVTLRLFGDGVCFLTGWFFKELGRREWEGGESGEGCVSLLRRSCRCFWFFFVLLVLFGWGFLFRGGGDGLRKGSIS